MSTQTPHHTGNFVTHLDYFVSPGLMLLCKHIRASPQELVNGLVHLMPQISPCTMLHIIENRGQETGRTRKEKTPVWFRES